MVNVNCSTPCDVTLRSCDYPCPPAVFCYWCSLHTDPCALCSQLGSLAAETCFPYGFTAAWKASVSLTDAITAEILSVACHSAEPEAPRRA